MCCLLQVRHGAGTGLREILKSQGASGGKLVGSTAEQVCWNTADQFLTFLSESDEYILPNFWLGLDVAAASRVDRGYCHPAAVCLCPGSLWGFCVWWGIAFVFKSSKWKPDLLALLIIWFSTSILSYQYVVQNIYVFSFVHIIVIYQGSQTYSLWTKFSQWSVFLLPMQYKTAFFSMKELQLNIFFLDVTFLFLLHKQTSVAEQEATLRPCRLAPYWFMPPLGYPLFAPDCLCQNRLRSVRGVLLTLQLFSQKPLMIFASVSGDFSRRKDLLCRRERQSHPKVVNKALRVKTLVARQSQSGS